MIDLRSVLAGIKPYVLGWISSYLDVGARVYNNANISVADVTAQVLTFNSERWDTDGIHSTSVNTGRLTCTQDGKYLIGGNVEFAANVNGVRGMQIRLNGGTVIAYKLAAATPSNNWRDNIHTVYDLAVGNYVELLVYQNTGGALNVVYTTAVSPEFWMQRMT